MDHEHQHRQDGNNGNRTISRSHIVLVGFLVVIGYFLFTEHRAHVIVFLPYLLLLACPLMHIFMHGGHEGHDRNEGDKRSTQKGEE